MQLFGEKAEWVVRRGVGRTLVFREASLLTLSVKVRGLALS